jgi:F420-non-reducing hydrogenase small subunit
MYWAASCGGCEMALLSLDEHLLSLNESFELVFCPCIVDAKRIDLEALPDGDIAFTLFNGGIRTDDDAEMAHLLRRKSQRLIAFGSCAHEGCIPGLANLGSVQAHIHDAFVESATTTNPRQIVPKKVTHLPEGELVLPQWRERLGTLAQTVAADYLFPGCPPEPHRVKELFTMISSGRGLPPAGSVIGGGKSAVCAECPRTRGIRSVKRLYRVHEKTTDPELCLLEQGIVCMGIATRDGCGCRCPRVNMPCTGCYGPPEGAADQGAAMISALAALIDIGPTGDSSPEEISCRIEALFETLPDYVGTFWKYSLADSLLADILRRDR